MQGENSEVSLMEGEKIVKLLVEAGAHLDSVNICDQTPAQIANIRKNEQSVIK